MSLPHLSLTVHLSASLAMSQRRFVVTLEPVLVVVLRSAELPVR